MMVQGLSSANVGSLGAVLLLWLVLVVGGILQLL